MEKRLPLINRSLKILKWVAIVLGGAFIVLIIVRVVHFFNLDKTNIAVAKIHSTKLTLDDVMGKSLPPDPGAEADKTVQGVDANKNGIRDDVELAIFKEYPNSAKTRAVLLQYALALQMEMTQDLINKETVTAVAEQTSRGYLCIGKILSRNDMSKYIEMSEKMRNFVESKHLNNVVRQSTQKNFYNSITSGTVPQEGFCDIDINYL